MTDLDAPLVACEPSAVDRLTREGLRPVPLRSAADRGPRLGPLDDLQLARWRGATEVVVRTGERRGPTNHPTIATYLAAHATPLGPGPGGERWALPPLPEPGPPAVFCLGLTKTGTSTLAEALEVLGLACLHWGGQPAHHAVLDALRAGEVITARLPGRWDAYTDVWSLSARFEILDLQHPGSRFVLTTRDVDRWIDSRRRHIERNRRNQAIGRYQGSNLEVDEEGWRALWHGHTDAVRRHFAGRDDLLELDLTVAPRWDELAAFLARPAPPEPFPKANVDGRPSAGRYRTFRREIAPDDQRAECPLCGTVVARFERSGTVDDRADCRCPTCGSLERHRAQWISIVDRTQLLEGSKRVLHVGPSPLYDRLLEVPGLEVERIAPLLAHPAARHPLRRLLSRAPAPVDLAALDGPDGRYDLVIVPHVLQRVADDRAALAHLARVIAPGGDLLASVPMFGTTTDDGSGEDLGPDARRRRFGDPAHVRAYGNDGAFEDRLRQAGLSVMVEDVASTIGTVEAARYRLGRPEPIQWGRRP